MKRIFSVIVFLTFVNFGSQGQEIITGLFENPVVKSGYEELKLQKASREDNTSPLSLPFFDDFTQTWIYPNSARWMDDEAYINTNFGYLSANVGVATLDAIDSKGNIHSNLSQFPGNKADSLTSRPIRLDSLFLPFPRAISVADSIYLSFYYQPQGRAKQAPESFDSLVLQFGYYTGDSVFTNTYDSIWVPLSDYIHESDTVFPGDTIYSPSGSCAEGLFIIAGDYYYYNDLIQLPCDSIFLPEFTWRRVWSSLGMSLEDFHTQFGTYSRQVMIPIRDSLKYYRNNFQFRFINYASLAGEIPSWKSNCDQWNIDYIYLNTGRSYKDTVFRDVTFAERAPSMLKRYEAMPYRQYMDNPADEMKDKLGMVITNMDSTIYNSTYYYVVYQVDGNFNYLYPGGNCNLFPYNIGGYQNCTACAAHACPPVSFIFPLSAADSAEFEIRHFIIGDMTPTDTVGDTVSFRQKFFNYYAYDDGTPEAGYGLSQAGSKLAYRFQLNVKDTLRAVQMFFNRTQYNANEDFFDLMVWQDNNGKPGDVIYMQPDEKVEYTDGLLGFHTYFLDEPQLVNGVFYIGWQQQTGDNLNLGYDCYNNAQQNIYHNTTGEWYQSIYQGALLMRPMLGKPFDFSGIGEDKQAEGSIKPYPNPLQGSRLQFTCSGIYTDPSSTAGYTVSLQSISGIELFSGPFRPSVETGKISPGIYILTVKDKEGQIISVSKLIKN